MKTTIHAATLLARVQQVADDFARERRDRQLRRELDPRDFERLRDAGFLFTGVPVRPRNSGRPRK